MFDGHLKPAALQSLLTECQLEARLFEHAASLLDLTLEASLAWESVGADLHYRPVSYARSSLAYQFAYLVDLGWQLQDCSLILLNDGRPCGIFPLTLGGPVGQAGLTSFGAPLMEPLFVPGLSVNVVKKICSRLLAFLAKLAIHISLPRLALQQAVLPMQMHMGLSEWSLQLLNLGASVSSGHEMYVDLRPSLEQIRAGFRKSYRPLINSGLRHWQVQVMEAQTADGRVWQELQALHLEVAGRKTRSEESWQRQYAMVEAGEAFVVSLRDPSTKRMVGAGVFQIYRDEGLYGVGAYDRALFDKPLGHVVQQIAIETFKRRGTPWYRLGARQYAQDSQAPSDKQLSISAFKNGFASHVFSRQEFAWQIPQVPVGSQGDL